MLVEDPETGTRDWVKVLDFGLARIREPSDEGRLTQTGVVMGTPSYMSPEQIRSARKVVDRSDVYTLGAILYEMLSGTRPFTSASDTETMFLHMTTEPRPLQELAPGLPQPLYELVHGMLKKTPDERPTAAQVASTLLRLSGLPSSAALAPLPADPKAPSGAQPSAKGQLPAVAALAHAPGGAEITSKAAARPTHQPGLAKSKTRLLVGIGLGLAVLAGGAAALFRARHAAEGEKVNWSIRSVPPGANVVSEDGQVLGQTPLLSQRPKRQGAQTLRLRKDGYNEARLTCEGGADCERETILVALTDTTSDSAPSSAAATDSTNLTAKREAGKTSKSDSGKKKSGKKPRKSK